MISSNNSINDRFSRGSKKIVKIIKNLKGKQSASEFSRKINVKYSTLSAILRGEQNPDLKLLFILSRYSPYFLGELATIACDEDQESTIIDNEGDRIAQDAEQAFKLISHLDNAETAKLIELIFERKVVSQPVGLIGSLRALLSTLASGD